MSAQSETEAAGAVDDASRQFVTFRMEGQVFAVPLVEVQEIIRLPDIVEVPLAAPHLKGLANLRGVVLPVVSLRRLFGMAEAVADDATRVVVMNAGALIGFVVDRMERVIAAEPREIESVRGIRATVDADMLQGVIKREDGLVMILETSKLMNGGAGERRGRERAAVANASAERSEAEQASDEIRLVSCEVERQEYALPIQCVEEIVQLPERVNEIPNAPAHLIGVINLRNRMLPLVSLRSLFALGPPPEGLVSRVVVVSRESDGASVGLVTDTVKEVVRAPKSAVDPLPRMISAQAGQRNVESICRLDGGKRLVTIMAPQQLFLNEGVGAALDAGEETTMADAHEASSDRADEEEQFVIFTLADEEYGVPIEAVQEIVRVPEQITRVPKTPAFVEGVINLRGAVMPIVDQRRRFALPEIAHNDRQRIVVFLVNGVRTGFIVDTVTEVLKVSRAQVSVAPELAADRDGAVSRVANLVEAKRLILMLDVDRLLSESELASLKRAA